MRAAIVSNHQVTARKAREALLHGGHDCPAENVYRLPGAADRLALARPEVVLVCLAPDPELALAEIAQLRHLVASPVLAIGPARDPQLILRMLRTGATDFVEEADLTTELEAALRRLRSEQGTMAELAQTIVLLGPSGGSGSSTLAANIATVLAQAHQKSLLLDLKLHSGDLATLLDLKPTHTLADLCRQAAVMDRVMFERSLDKHASGVHLLAPPRSFADVEQVTAEAMGRVLALGRDLFPYVVVDLDHSFREEQTQVLRQANVVLLVLRLDFASLRNAQRTLDYLTRHLGIAPDQVQLVANRHGQAHEVAPGKAEEALGTKILHFIPDDPKTVNWANNNGVPMVLQSPWAKVSRSVAKMAQSVNGRLHKGRGR
jgi:pilus assembly protein CpaE